MDPTIVVTAILSGLCGVFITRLVESFVTLQPESKLPVGKDEIRRALASALLEKLDAKSREHLETGYVQLECFLSSEEYDRGGSYLDKLVNSDHSKKLLEPHRNQGTIDRTALYSLIGELKNVPLQTDIFEKVSQRMKQRTEEIRLLRTIAGQAESADAGNNLNADR